MIITRPQMALGPSSGAPIRSNGNPNLVLKSQDPPTAIETVELTEPLRTTKWALALAGVMTASMVAGHFTNVVPSATIAKLTNDQFYDELTRLEEFGTFIHKHDPSDAEKAYRGFGHLISSGDQSSPHYLRLPHGTRVRLENREDASDLLELLEGTSTLEASPEQIQMAKDLANYQKENPEEYEWVDVVLRATGRLYEARVSADGHSYEAHDLEKLAEIHDFVFGSGDGFTAEERALLPQLERNPLGAIARLERGSSVTVSHETDYGVTLKLEVETREELVEAAKRMQGQKELEQYRPSPERLQFLMGDKIVIMQDFLTLTELQNAPLQDWVHVDQETLDTEWGAMREAQEAMADFRESVENWDGSTEGLPEEYSEMISTLNRFLNLLDDSDWMVSSKEHRSQLRPVSQKISKLMKTLDAEQAPEGWELPSYDLEGYVERTGAGTAL